MNTLKAILLASAVLLTSCQTLNYYREIWFVVPENPFKQTKKP